jgi:hypothetical protein
MNRRCFLVSASVASAGVAAGRAGSADGEMPKPGDRWNESEIGVDSATGRPRRRLTSRRRYNQQPTYHLNACFSRDSRFLVLTTDWDDQRSAVLKANVETGELTVIATGESVRPPVPNSRFNGNNISFCQAANCVAAKVGRSVRLYDLDTFKERVLIEDAGQGYTFGHPVGSIDGTKIYKARMKTMPNPEVDGNPATHLEIDIATTKVREIFQEKVCSCNHVVPCPGNPELLLFDRDMPPKFGRGGDGGKTTRVWVMNVKTGNAVVIQPRDSRRFQPHSNWNWKGDLVYYHGPSARGGQYIGVATAEGKVLFEHWLPEYIYGHMCSHTRRNAMVTDGIFARDLITAVHFEDLDSNGAPRLEILGRHSTDWDAKYGQYSHPHCHVSPDGKWLSYNRGEKDRTDVYALRIT